MHLLYMSEHMHYGCTGQLQTYLASSLQRSSSFRSDVCVIGTLHVVIAVPISPTAARRPGRTRSASRVGKGSA